MAQPVSLQETTTLLHQRLSHLLQAQTSSKPKQRIIIALAGVPGSGKSTVCNALLRALHDSGFNDAAVLPMVSIMPCI